MSGEHTAPERMTGLSLDEELNRSIQMAAIIGRSCRGEIMDFEVNLAQARLDDARKGHASLEIIDALSTIVNATRAQRSLIDGVFQQMHPTSSESIDK